MAEHPYGSTRPVRATTRKVLRATLTWSDGAGAHRVVVDTIAVVGTATGCELVVMDAGVSRVHAELEIRADGLWVRDLGSRNGTYVDGLLVGRVRASEGSRIKVGTTQVTVHYDETADLGAAAPAAFGGLVGGSPPMVRLYERLRAVAPSELSVLIMGETGTGKELVARSIHEASPRAKQPYVVVDCASMPEHLLEPALFGHARGAFTGASHARAGAFEEADGGTVFLDEIAELPLSMQPRLLRALESRSVKRVGESEYRPLDVRFVSATHRDLRRMVNAGSFREDLYFRLAAVNVVVPPLRDRLEDVPLLVRKFAPKLAGTAEEEALLSRLRKRTWSGNVRELRNHVERALALGFDEESELAVRDVPVPPSIPEEGDVCQLPLADLRERWIASLEADYLKRLIAKYDRNISAMARDAGLNRTYLHKLLKRHGL